MIRTVFASLLAAVALLLGSAGSASAQSITAQSVFGMLQGTTTIDPGGSIASQARSIYSFGGGMITNSSKKVSLLAADPPTYGAGCSGISWHFGGFAFISMDEIRQMVEAISQASLGVAVDLAMQTLCPQCYSIMAKLRDIANQMRNAAFDSCRIAKAAVGEVAKMLGAEKTKNTCAASEAKTGASDSYMGGIARGICSALDSAASKLKSTNADMMAWMNGDTTKKTPDYYKMLEVGNTTYQALSALGYKDGVTKDLLLSFLGMEIKYPGPAKDCSEALASITPTKPPDTSAETSDPAGSPEKTNETKAGRVSEVDNYTSKISQVASKDPADADKGYRVCHAPPILRGKDIALFVLCGEDPTAEYDYFKNKFHGITKPPIAVMAMCGLEEDGNPTAKAEVSALVAKQYGAIKDQWVYHCRGDNSANCMQPSLRKMSDIFAPNAGGYTGLAWMVMDALYQGVQDVKSNNPAGLKADTIAVLERSDYPLYRVLNMAAVYPDLAADLLSSYGATIAMSQLADSLGRIFAPGSANPSVDTSKAYALSFEQINILKQQISNIDNEFASMAENPLRQLEKKKSLIDTILRVNRALQAEVVSRGLAGNAAIAIRLKKQTQAPVTPGSP